ncbi:MAG: FAD-dependent oxidoreductase [Candidatus Nealsonbacteria bacterium]|nr:FAD-dependent oxidoreductase [Candidatus Nealsonbacteria bacterium]
MKQIYDLIIVGGGPAGMTAGIYSARQRLKTLLIAKASGGQMSRKAVNIENYPGLGNISGFDLIRKFESHLKEQKIDIEKNTVRKIKKDKGLFSILTSDKKQFQSKTVIIASGADPRPLEVPGEKEFIGRGISYCVSCDGPLFAGKTVAVIGGGNAGFEAALSLSSYVKKIYILEAGAKIGAHQDIQEKVEKTGKVEVITEAGLKKVEGKDFVESAVYQDKKTKKDKTIQLQGIFVEIGSQPATSFVKDLVSFNEKDEIIVDPKTNQTKTPGLFAAGDVDNVPYKQIVIACGEGAKAAISASIYLQKL